MKEVEYVGKIASSKEVTLGRVSTSTGGWAREGWRDEAELFTLKFSVRCGFY